MDSMSDSDYMNMWWDGEDNDYEFERDDWDYRNVVIIDTGGSYRRPRGSRYRGGDREQPNRWRCLTVGCNPKLFGEDKALEHKEETGHRVAKWPVRSEEGKRKARERNQNGYYDKYNVGAKSAYVRLGRYGGW